MSFVFGQSGQLFYVLSNEVVFSLHRNTLGGIVKLKKPFFLLKVV